MPPKRRSKKGGRPKSVPPEDLIDDVKRKEVLRTFKRALPKGETTLSISESKAALKSLGMDVKSDEIRSFVARGDQNELFDESSFLHFAALKLLQTEKAHKAFDLMDVDQKGVVVLEDLQRVAQELGEDFSERELMEMIEFVDRSGDGMLRPKDFARIARRVKL